MALPSKFLCQQGLFHVVAVLQIQFTCALMAMTLGLVPSLTASRESTDSPPGETGNLSQLINNLTVLSQAVLPTNATQKTDVKPNGVKKAIAHEPVTSESDIPREFPTALVIASSIAAVCILVFFFVAYFWHTHQLDSRARKLAIRMAADSETSGARCKNCTPRVQGGYRRPVPESLQEQNHHYEVLTTEDDERGGPGSDGGRSSVGVSESEVGDSEDLFELSQPPQLPEKTREGTRIGRSAHRKWSRTRKASGASMDKRDSAVTDKEILSHFASRRHSTFFI